MKQLRDIGEDSLVETLIEKLNQKKNVVIGPGDDCAVVDVENKTLWQLLKTDSLVEGVHYLPDENLERVGWKAIARVVSDFAAMGGYPDQLLVTIALPGNLLVEKVEKLYDGMVRCAERFDASICGGETAAIPDGASAVISISGTGWVKKENLIRRSGGEVGDIVFVTGLLGGSIQGKHLDFTPRLEEAHWLVENFDIHAMMDLSDGLAKDLPRLAKLSGSGYNIKKEYLPLTSGCNIQNALEDGEDYELLFTVSKETAPELLNQWKERFPKLALTQIGSLTDTTVIKESGGWEHFF